VLTHVVAYLLIFLMHLLTNSLTYILIPSLTHLLTLMFSQTV